MNELSLFNTLFNDSLEDNLPEFNFHATFATPKVDVKEGKDAYTLEMDLPGRTEKDVSIELDNNTLTIASVKEENKQDKSDKDEKDSWLIRERKVCSFSRRFTLPSDVDCEKVGASFKNGVLTVRIPRKALPSPKKIAIEAA